MNIIAFLLWREWAGDWALPAEVHRSFASLTLTDRLLSRY
jgi:hypothetical protein